MKVEELMTRQVVSVNPNEPVAVAARTLTHYNVGMVPVCDESGKLRGILTDRDIVTRCLAAQRSVEETTVGQIMTTQIFAVPPGTEVSAAAHLMGTRQVKRLLVVDSGQLCGIVSIGDLANNSHSMYDAVDALSEITGNISDR